MEVKKHKTQLQPKPGVIELLQKITRYRKYLEYPWLADPKKTVEVIRQMEMQIKLAYMK